MVAMKAQKLSERTKTVLVLLREEFLDEIDKAYPLAGFNDRSSFIRDAVYQALVKMGIDVPIIIKTAPDRKGKGGTPTHHPKKKRGDGHRP